VKGESGVGSDSEIALAMLAHPTLAIS
jgi:hypothetical protein